MHIARHKSQDRSMKYTHSYMSSLLVLNFKDSGALHGSNNKGVYTGAGETAMTQYVRGLITTIALMGGYSVGPELLLVSIEFICWNP